LTQLVWEKRQNPNIAEVLAPLSRYGYWMMSDIFVNQWHPLPWQRNLRQN